VFKCWSCKKARVKLVIKDTGEFKSKAFFCSEGKWDFKLASTLYKLRKNCVLYEEDLVDCEELVPLLRAFFRGLNGDKRG